MLHRIPWVFVLGLAIVWPLGAVEESKKDSDDTTEAKPPVLKGKWNAVGAVYGTVKSVSGDGMTLVVEYQEMQQNPKGNTNNNPNNAAQRQMQNFQNQLNAANRIKNPAQKAARIQQIMAQMQAAGLKQAMAQNNNFKMVTKKKDVDVQLGHELQVRVKDPPQEFDEKGQVKKYTSEELKKLKGPGNYWGYPSDVGNLRPGAVVQAFLYKKAKTAARPAPKGSLGKKEGDKDKEGDKAKDDDKPKDEGKSKDEEKSKSSKSAPAEADDDDGTDPVVKVVYVRQESTQAGNKKGGKNK